jgi:tetratricopeptide (TPR) repeat protein
MIGQLLADRYRVTQVFAAETYIASDTFRPGYPLGVVKQLHPKAEAAGLNLALETRLAALENLGIHPQIPLFRAAFGWHDALYQVEELITGHALSQELRAALPWSEQRVRRLLRDVLEILVFTHRQGVIHQDVQPANLIRRQSDGKLVLINWLSMPLQQPAPPTPYQAPEQEQGNALFNSDVYALGIMAMQALTGTTAADLPNLTALANLSRWRDRAAVSSTLADVIDRMTCRDFRQRYQSATEVLHLMQPAYSGGAVGVDREPTADRTDRNGNGLKDNLALGTTTVPAMTRPSSAPLTVTKRPAHPPKDAALAVVAPAPAVTPRSRRRWFGVAALLLGGGVVCSVAAVPALQRRVWPPTSDVTAMIQRSDQAIRANPRDRAAYHQRGLAQAQLHNWSAALADFTQALQIDPNDDSSYFQRGQTRFQLGDAQGAIEDYTQAINLNRQQAPFFMHRGIALMAMEENLPAQQDFDQAIQLNPRLASAYLSRCQVKTRLNDAAKAIGDCTQAANLDPNLVAAYQNRGIAHRQSANFQTAITDFNLALRLQPNDPVTYYQRALTRKAVGDNKGAIADLDTTLQQDPNYALAYYERALLQAKFGNRANAIRDLQTAAQHCIDQGMTGCYRNSQNQLKKLSP